MNSVPAIQANDLRKTYTSGWFGRKRFEALCGVDFAVKQGEIFGLLGPNGAGKTTFVKVLLGVIRSTGGSAEMLGQPAGSRAARKQVGYLPEALRIRGHHTALSAMEYYGRLSGLSLSQVRERRGPLLELVGLADRRKDSVKKFSKGMLQRLGLAQALLHEPRMLMLDEPTDGLDPRARAEMRQLMMRLRNEGKTVFLNSHILQEVELVCDRVAILDRGQLKYCGAVDQVGEFVAAQQNGAPVQGAVATHDSPGGAVSSGGQPAWQVDLEIGADPTTVNQVLGAYQLEQLEAVGEQHVRMRVRLQDQAAVDQLIDQIRAAQLSLIGLSRAKVSLESAFLELLDENREGTRSNG